MSSLDLSAYKPDPGDDGDATQVAGGFTALEAYLNGNLPLVAHKQDGASPGQAIIWNGTQWAAGTPAPGTQPGAELSYTQIVAPVTVAGASEAAATAVITAAPVTLDGSPVLIEFVAAGLLAGAAGTGAAHLTLFEDGLSLGDLYNGQLGASEATVGYGNRRRTPAAGSHTYAVKGYRASANFTVQAGAGGPGAIGPAYLRVTRI